MIRLGLTGGIGMGKSTIAALFAEHDIPTFNADDIVHQLQAPHGGAIPALAKIFPDLVIKGVLNRAGLRALVLKDAYKMRQLEQIMHPLVHAARADFINKMRGKKALLFDIPLLFETNGQAAFDKIIVVSCPRAVQIARVLARGLPLAEVEAIIDRQMSDAQKRVLADYVIETGEAIDSSRKQVNAIIKALGL